MKSSISIAVALLASLALAGTAAAGEGEGRPNGAHGAKGGGKRGHALKALDKDGDGRISKAEAAGHEKLAARFASLDTNSDGYLTREELKAGHKGGGKKDGKGGKREGKGGEGRKRGKP